MALLFRAKPRIFNLLKQERNRCSLSGHVSQCPKCLLDLAHYPSPDGTTCPNCGKPLMRSNVAPLGPGAVAALTSKFWSATRDIIFRPTAYFSKNAGELLASGSLSSALAFAVIIQWLASFFNFLWRSTAGIIIQSRVDDFFRIAGDIMSSNPAAPSVLEDIDQVRRHAIEFFFGAGAIILTPFSTVIKLALIALFVHAAVRFFMKDVQGRSHSYSTTLKILAYSSAPWILCVIPGFGLILAYVLSFGASVVGIREVYKTSTSRAVLAIIFPELLFLVFIMGIGVFFLFLAFNVLRLVF